jgi:hypothetical protein
MQEIKKDDVEEVGGGLSLPGDPFGFPYPQPMPAPLPGPRIPGPIPVPEQMTDGQQAV